MAQDPPELAWAVAVVVVGVVVAGVSVVEVVELVAFDDADFVDFVEVVGLVAVVVGLAVVAVVVVVAAAVEWCEVCVAARLVNRPTPAREAAATVPVIRRVRRKISFRGEEGMDPLSGTGLGGT